MKPWQMTDLRMIKRLADAGKIQPWETTRAQNIQYMIIQGLGAEGQGRAIEHHRRAIQQALVDGKSVPPEVLVDYPELQQDYLEFDEADTLTDGPFYSPGDP